MNWTFAILPPQICNANVQFIPLKPYICQWPFDSNIRKHAG